MEGHEGVVQKFGTVKDSEDNNSKSCKYNNRESLIKQT